jgi:ATP-dependent RNA helicase DeaD
MMSIVKFDDLGIGKDILLSLDKMGYERPSEVQKKIIPLALINMDIVVKSQTGSGKTAAFGIPICERIEIESKKPQALVLTPTRELAVQVKEDITNIGRFKKIRCAAVFGKQPMDLQVRELKQRVHIVVGTPGRTKDHIDRGTLELEDIKYLIIDEADEMLNMGFIDQVEAIIELLPKDRVTMLFSATISEEIEKLCNRYMENPEKVEINPNNVTVEKIDEFYYEAEERSKYSLLDKILYTQNPDSCIIFCNTKEAVDSLFQRMNDRDYPCERLHGGMEQRDRLDTFKRFKLGEFRFLIATDVAARGVHIDDISHVVNFDIPYEKESYVHRIGRTGRSGSEGTAITFVSPHEYRFLREIETYVGYKITQREVPTDAEVEEGKKIFKEKIKTKPKLKKDTSSELNKEITKIYISGGKKNKMRPGDIVGAITSIEGVTSENIGIIDIQDNHSYVDILGGKGGFVLKSLESTTIKGKKFKVGRAIK